MVPGIRIIGSRVLDCDVQICDSFVECPVAYAVGVPLRVNREPATGEEHSCYLAVRFMTDPRWVLAPPEWQYGSALGPAPPVVAGRSDGVPFTSEDWRVLDDFMEAMFGDGPRKVERTLFLNFVCRQTNAPFAFLDIRYPKGANVRAQGLKATALNGIVGVISGKYEKGRVGVVFPDHGLKAIKPANLAFVDYSHGNTLDGAAGHDDESRISQELDDEDIVINTNDDVELCKRALPAVVVVIPELPAHTDPELRAAIKMMFGIPHFCKHKEVLGEFDTYVAALQAKPHLPLPGNFLEPGFIEDMGWQWKKNGRVQDIKVVDWISMAQAMDPELLDKYFMGCSLQQGACWHCGSTGQPLFRCKSCQKAAYCSKACQKASWWHHKRNDDEHLGCC
mmetsp:Transcript_107088/g.194931  ORF Transcript_107088/g.194931 Transcript_107088/m.194931 type:complete len:393 (+) Transcript_107088:44-1222(+)